MCHRSAASSRRSRANGSGGKSSGAGGAGRRVAGVPAQRDRVLAAALARAAKGDSVIGSKHLRVFLISKLAKGIAVAGRPHFSDSLSIVSFSSQQKVL